MGLIDRLDRVQLYMIFAASGALIGVIVTPLVYWAKAHHPISGFFVGLLVGAFGNLILLIPLWLSLHRPIGTGNKSAKIVVTAAYNKGIAAILGGRRDEARSWFVEVTQTNPQHVEAWLNLANLATSPLEAWSYVQQARAIAPNNPSVQQAVNIVWPQVRHLYGEGSS
ncbi:MAG: hypothetical protein ABI947_11270 [Chloroflexota bacterium]